MRSETGAKPQYAQSKMVREPLMTLRLSVDATPRSS
jgi:hypothetical protein